MQQQNRLLLRIDILVLETLFISETAAILPSQTIGLEYRSQRWICQI
jgi:hypothetical protein